jgi:hypothetical protein
MSSDHPIPDDLREAFERAVVELIHWDRGGEEPSGIGLSGKFYSISDIAGLAGSFKDRMRESTLRLLLKYASSSLTHQDEQVELGKDPTYETGARCVLQWVRDKKKLFGQ